MKYLSSVSALQQIVALAEGCQGSRLELLPMQQTDKLSGLPVLELLMQQAGAHTECIGHRHKDALSEFQGLPTKQASWLAVTQAQNTDTQHPECSSQSIRFET